ncbi:hypothetical protein PR001_g509 [Phytophthora rubi]|uniref:Calcineurin-like phosphoesterase domain-containing protein n=1 Tax=Phytophthora rubi TaxID=129364 RepID=A0A6A3PFQ2_9STRA|nr:hypothetical protein PR002_g537 [Phytophthora rubi]KAE9052440.1 hypothetical protein PR001_g509 [Phytophthora rubi]
MARWQLALLAAAVLLCQAGFFYLQAWRCELQIQQKAGDADALTVLVVTDVHLLGRRRRSRVERLWVDWQVRASARAAVDVHKPEVALVLGDQFDEGSRWTPDAHWDEYADRFFCAFASFLPLKTLYLVGNHDTSFGREMRIEDLKRFEVTFGAANRIDEIGGHTFVSLNTMALDSDVASGAVKTEARSFLESVNFADLRGRTSGSVILLTHLPLFRVDDLQCGEERLRESGHVTYEHPGFKYEIHHHVLSRALSEELLGKVQPNLVLSGHTHAWCAYQHPDAAAMEYTIPAFSWGQRPDPSYAVLRLPRAGRAEMKRPPELTACHLPSEPLIFATYAATIGTVVLASVVQVVLARRAAPKAKVTAANGNCCCRLQLEATSIQLTKTQVKFGPSAKLDATEREEDGISYVYCAAARARNRDLAVCALAARLTSEDMLKTLRCACFCAHHDPTTTRLHRPNEIAVLL